MTAPKSDETGSPTLPPEAPLTLDQFLANAISDCVNARGQMPVASGNYAEEASYTVRILIDGNELHLPFVIHAGRDYGLGEPLETVCAKVADDLMNGRYTLGDEAVVSVYTLPAEDCTDDDEPLPLATATAYRW